VTSRLVRRTLVLLVCLPLAAHAQSPKPLKIETDWSKILLTSKSTATLQVVVNPPLRRGSEIHDAAFRNLKNLGADYVRYVPWLPYPRLAVAELEPPTPTTTSWDFSLIDPMTVDFLNATEGHSVILNFSTAPAWLFKTDAPVKYPEDPNEVTWHYTQGSELKDPTGQDLAAYYARLVDWYTNGGFSDENGKRHDSGHHFNIPYWEVFNEPDIEHHPTPEQYTERYDSIVAAIRKDNPQMKFVGLALAFPSTHPEMFEYFLNHANHKPGIPLDMISYHFYATPTPEQTADHWQYTFFDQADRFLATVRYIEEIRKRLSPETRTTVDEIGSILSTDFAEPPPPIPDAYWRLSGALFSYIYIDLVQQGIDVIGESQLVGYPTQFPSVSMLNWKSGEPNARLAALQLLKDNFGPGDQVVTTKADGQEVAAQAFEHQGKKKLLLVNKRDRSISVELPGEFSTATLSTISGAADGAKPVQSDWHGTTLTLAPFAVVVLAAGS